MGETFNKVADLLSEQLGISKSEIALDSDVIKDLGADSLDVVQLLMSLEEDFGITVSGADASNLKTIENIIKLIG